MATTTTQSNHENVHKSTAKKAVGMKQKAQARSAAKTKAKSKPAEGISSQLYHQGRDAASRVYKSAAEIGASASRAMPDLRGNFDMQSRGRSVYSTMEEHPFVIGAVGLGVGMVLAALLPSVGRLRKPGHSHHAK